MGTDAINQNTAAGLPSISGLPGRLFRIDHVFGALSKDLRDAMREAAHEIMRLEELVANPPGTPDRRDILRLIEKHYHETDAMADALVGVLQAGMAEELNIANEVIRQSREAGKQANADAMFWTERFETLAKRLEISDEALADLFSSAEMHGGQSPDDEDLSGDAVIGRAFLRHRDAIALKIARTEALERALRPLAVIADWFDSFDRRVPDETTLAYGDAEYSVSVGDCRRAKALLSGGALEAPFGAGSGDNGLNNKSFSTTPLQEKPE